jgi:hypothetical protein
MHADRHDAGNRLFSWACDGAQKRTSRRNRLRHGSWYVYETQDDSWQTRICRTYVDTKYVGKFCSRTRYQTPVSDVPLELHQAQWRSDVRSWLNRLLTNFLPRCQWLTANLPYVNLPHKKGSGPLIYDSTCSSSYYRRVNDDRRNPINHCI